MKLDLFQVDAFTEKVFSGNPAAVVPLENWIAEELMQKIASENNLSETAFFVKIDDKYEIRWFTPANEVPLCGHATLASSFVIFNILKLENERIVFSSKSGDLIITKSDELITLNFPVNRPMPADLPDGLVDAIGVVPQEILFNDAYLAVLENEEQVRRLVPNYSFFPKFEIHGLIVTARAKDYDFVSRFFVPAEGIPEDPVTGFAHTILTPYWSEKLGKTKMSAYQASPRGGELIVENLGERVNISGKAAFYMKGEISI